MLFKRGDLLQFVLDDPRADFEDETPYTFGYSRYNVDGFLLSTYLTTESDEILVERDAHRFNPIISECTNQVTIKASQGFNTKRYSNRPESTIIKIER